jgi:peptidoglycan/xylan/chitin deacetylase (PgdA/CDA1 family)
MVHLRLRARLAGMVQAARLGRAVLARQRRAPHPRWVAVLTYHRIAPRSAAQDTDLEVLSATPETFDSQLRTLRRYLTPITLKDLSDHLEGASLPPNPVLVTFDDGYLDNVDVALPILVRHAVQAVFFVATEYVARRKLFWWDRISWIVKHAQRPCFAVPGLKHVEVDTRDGPALERRLHDIVKHQHGLDIEGFLQALAAAADAPWGPEVEQDLVRRHIMTWDHVRALHEAGMDVASHTRTHRVLQTVPASELEGELSGSRADLEAVLGVPVQAISYPVGRPVGGDALVLRAVQAAGYRVGFTYDTGRQDLGVLDPLQVRRLAVERTDSDQDLLTRVAFPWLEGRSDRHQARW